MIAWRSLYPRWWPFHGGGIASRIALGLIGWVILTPLVLACYSVVLLIFTALHWQPDEHPLTQMGTGIPFEQVLFLLQACVAAPLVEELIFRGLLLPWTIGARERNAGGPPASPLVPPVSRPALVMAFGVVYAAMSAKVGPVVFAGILAGGLAVIWVTVRHGKRHLRGVYAVAALFAVVHSDIWPSPIPLFLLGLGLGWLAVRTRGVFVPALVHGLFNAVSAVFVLRGGAG